MLKPKDVTFPWIVVSGGDKEALIVDVKDTPEYVDGKATDKVVGKTYTAILPNQSWEKVQIKVESTADVITADMLQQSSPIKAEFIGANARWWYNTRINDYALSVKATGIKLADKK